MKTERFGYPRPMLVREGWTCLNGVWDFAIDRAGGVHSPGGVTWDRKIEVPFAPETPASGVGDTSFYPTVWYRRSFDAPRRGAGDRVVLHFGAVDFAATVWVNGGLAVRHEGGYTPFSADVTELLVGAGEQVVVVRAEDDPHDLCKPRGKQEWQAAPHAIWYPRTTGIWQTVWLEVVPATRVAGVVWTPKVATAEMRCQVRLAGDVSRGWRVRVRLAFGERVLVEDSCAVQRGEVTRTFVLGDGGVEDFNLDFLWSPEASNLIDAVIELVDEAGAVADRVTSYCALRSVGVEGDRVTLNRRPVQLRMALDQGYWRETGLTAPDDAAHRRDVELAKAMGFNGVRKHQKIEDPRFLYWADRLGLFVWEECPSAYRYDPLASGRLVRTWTEAVERDRSHPCIIAWVPLNESWGVPDLATDASQRDFVRAMYHLTRALDPTRLVVGNDGWEAVAGDFVGIHDYERDPAALLKRYDIADEGLAQLFRRHRIGGRPLLTTDFAFSHQPILLTEFGGIGFSAEAGAWGYKVARTKEELAAQYTELLRAVHAIPIFGGFCYTQFTDTYQEANGLLTMEREPKFPIEEIRRATAG